MNNIEVELNDELDELMMAATAQKKVAAEPKRVGTLDDLDDLLASAVAQRDEIQATKSMREKLKRGKMTSDERHEIEAKVREWESRNVWNTVANVAVFEHISCECGFYSEVFSHLMHRQVHKHTANTTRLIVADTMAEGVPQIVAKQNSDVGMCSECAAGKGWDLESGEVMEWTA